LLLGVVGTAPVHTPDQPREPQTIIVKMVDISPTEYAFEPAAITARPGDVIQFVQAGVMPHNVEFREGPAGTTFGEIRMGPFLTQPDETYEIVIGDSFANGVHEFVCTPHEFLGMTGTLTVEGAAR
jgi:plastocyanin